MTEAIPGILCSAVGMVIGTIIGYKDKKTGYRFIVAVVV